MPRGLSRAERSSSALAQGAKAPLDSKAVLQKGSADEPAFAVKAVKTKLIWQPSSLSVLSPLKGL